MMSGLDVFTPSKNPPQDINTELCGSVLGVPNKITECFKVSFKGNTAEIPTPSKPGSMFSVFREFAEGTSFHGLRFVVRKGSFIGRKLLWLIMLCTCAGVLVFEIVDRVKYYYDWPVTVNVRVNYNSTLRFPAVTICNQNGFKATLSNRLQRYRLLETMYTSDTFNENDLGKFGADNITLEDLFLQSAHHKDDFIAMCYWKGKQCSPDDFKTTLTDHGVCYTFDKDDQEEYISAVGVENGLRLTLNVEQYEYMPGPHDAAGIKMLLHSNGDVPRVHALGQAVSTGSHVFVGVKVSNVNNLPPPHGSCSHKELKYTNLFTMDGCQMDCLTQLADIRCHCRHTYMLHKDATGYATSKSQNRSLVFNIGGDFPVEVVSGMLQYVRFPVTGNPPVCTLYQYYSCLKPLIDEFPSIQKRECECPVPCGFNLYEADISYASTSQYAANRFLNYNIESLSSALLDATEVTSRMENATFQRTKFLAHNFEEVLRDMETLLTVNLTDVLSDLNTLINETFVKTKDMYSMREFLYRFQTYIVQKNFMRPRDAMEERTIHIVALAYAEFILTIESRIRLLANVTFTDSSARLMMYEDAILKLDNRKEIVKRAYNNYSQLIEAYDTGYPIFNYSFEGLPIELNIPATPRYLIMESRVHNSYAIRNGELFGKYLNITMERLDWLKQLVDIAYWNASLDEDRMFYCREEFQYYMRNFMFAKSVFYYETIEWPVGILQQRLTYFSGIWQQYSVVLENIQESLKSLVLELYKTKTMFLVPLYKLQRDINDHIQHGNTTKISIAEVLTSQNIQDGITEFRTFFQHLRVREANLIDCLNRLEEDVLEMWRIVISDIDSVEYYKHTNGYQYLRNFSDVAAEVTSTFLQLKNISYFSRIVTNKDSLFVNVLEAFYTDAREYIESTKIDNEFIKNNFLQLDLFYRQLSYEELNQQIGYDSFALICDIGGAMGLFLGASVLSILEICDLIFVQMMGYTKRILSRSIEKAWR